MLGSTHSASKTDREMRSPTVIATSPDRTADSLHRSPLPELPSSPFQYSRWHELENCKLRGSQLHCPRIREGPESRSSLHAAHSVSLHKTSPGRKDHRNTMENWEHAESVNLSFQVLGDPYQTKNFRRCLRRLTRCTHLQLMDNALSDLSRITLPSCTHLNLSRNNFSSFKKLPKAPKLEHLSLSQNRLLSLSGLSSLSRYPHLHSVILKGNPIEFSEGYRHRVFKVLPSLESLDGYPRLPCDLERSPSGSSSSSDSSTHSTEHSTTCTIS